MFGEVFESLQGFYNHDFMLYIYVVGDDNEATRSFMCKPFRCVKKICWPKSTKKKNIVWFKREQRQHKSKKLVEVHSPTQIYAQ
jgi:hypothetical protein